MELIKNLLKRNKKISHYIFAVYLEWVFLYRWVLAFIVGFLVNLLRRLVVKGNVTSFRVGKHKVELSYLHKDFYWVPNDRTSLLGLVNSGEYEKEELGVVLRYIKPGMVVLDVGANFGFYSIFFADKTGDRGHVYAFEPLKSTYKELLKNVSLNNSESIITTENLGLSNKSGKVTIYVAKALGTGATSLKKRWYGENKKYTCQLVTLDRYVERHDISHVDFIKCDVEGAELLVFQGAKETIKRFRPILFFESIDNHTELFGYTTQELTSYVKAMSYHVIFVQNGNYLALPKKRRVL